MNNLANHPTPGKTEIGSDHEKSRRNSAYVAKAVYGSDQQYLARNYLRRKLRESLSPSEYMLVDFIFDRTIEWGKSFETIRMSQFMTGSLPWENGERSFCGTRLSERTIRDALNRLENKGGCRAAMPAGCAGAGGICA